MKTKLAFIQRTALLLLLSMLIVQPSTVLAQGTIFTYQGSLNDNGSPANGTNYGMVFYLYDAPSNGTVFANLGIVSVSVSNGLFTVPLDFGTNFPGADRWLEITVQKNGGGFTTLTPRQKLTPTPYAITAANLSGSLPAVQLTGNIPSASIAGPYSSAVTMNNPANNFTGVFTGNGAGLTNIPTSGSAWQLTGDAGTTAGVNFLGTTDNQPLELKVNGVRGMRLEPTAVTVSHIGIVNVVGGSPANFVAPGTIGATIAGGGAMSLFGPGPSTPASNTISVDFAFIGGGYDNTIQTGSYNSVISGGAQNAIQANADKTTISGGFVNSISANSSLSTISGGGGNSILSGSIGSTVGGGQNNTIQAYSGDFTLVSSDSTISGGQYNSIWTNAINSTIGGGDFNMIQVNASNSVVDGGMRNSILTGSPNSTIGGGLTNTIQANASFSTISGGANNTIQTYASWSAIGGGQNNTIQPNAIFSTISGGGNNVIQNGANDSVIGGGFDNTILSGSVFSTTASTISGGQNNTIQTNAVFSSIGGGSGNTTVGQYSTIGGGVNNAIQTNANGCTISGGENNTIQTNAYWSTIGGGVQNTIQSNSTLAFSTIAGGYMNTIQTNSSGATIGGGQNNTIQSNAYWSTIGGGQNNTIQINAFYSTTSGGNGNAAAGNFATVPGGDQNVAGTNSFAAGHRAKATNTGAFVWADSTDVDFASTADNQFLIRASGGVGIGANNPDATLTVNGTADKPGGGAWTVFSDARLKKNIEPLTGALERLLELRAVTFEYKDPQSIHELPGIQIGMIAQEVEKVFPDWVDTAPNGMKRLSIHGFEALTVESLRELRAEKDAKISELEKSNAEMQQQLATQKELNNQMAARFDALEKTVARLADQSSVPVAINEQASK